MPLPSLTKELASAKASLHNNFQNDMAKRSN
jgi:hypothetical protein